jgi:ABC-type bacteriocin/lantibiotic exporter with double-glycine peptidase domain
VHFLSGILNILDQKERVRLFLLIFFDIVVSALDVAFLGCTIIVVNFYIQNARLPYLARIPHFLADRNSILLIAIFFILFAIKNAFAYWVSASRFRFIYGVASRLSERNVRHYLKDEYLNFVNTDSSAHIRRISQQPIEFANYILINFQQIISQSVLVFFTICAILLYHATLFLLLFLLLMPALILLGWLLKQQLKTVRQNIKKTNAETLKNLREALSGYIESNLYDKDDFFTNRYYTQQQQLNQYIAKQQSLQALPSRLIEVFALLDFLILIVINKWSAHSPAIDLLTIGIFIAAAYKIIPGMVKILNSAGQMKTYEFTLNDLLNSDSIQTDAPVEAMEAIHSISFEKVNFRYNGRAVLNGVCFEIQPGDFAGVSADSGKGKTTLMHILLGFMEPEDGIIRINHKIAAKNDRRACRSRISYIKQQPFFIHDTVAKNITLQEKGYNEAGLKNAVAFCGLDGFLDQYPEGLQHVITENGKNISGGQRQRIMLARALYHGFDLLILDEPFGEMDQASEDAILQQLKLLADRGKMIIFITHNKSSLAFCNKIISLDD